jgi:HEAT repeat protein
VLIEMLTNQDWVVGGDAARAFAKIGLETLPEVIQALVEILKTDASERPTDAQSLLVQGVLLAELLSQESGGIRRGARPWFSSK